jgi:hypothetical protein
MRHSIQPSSYSSSHRFYCQVPIRIRASTSCFREHCTFNSTIFCGIEAFWEPKALQDQFCSVLSSPVENHSIALKIRPSPSRSFPSYQYCRIRCFQCQVSILSANKSYCEKRETVKAHAVQLFTPSNIFLARVLSTHSASFICNVFASKFEICAVWSTVSFNDSFRL